jgi:predicted benzoate:H+ symporter BenE
MTCCCRLGCQAPAWSERHKLRPFSAASQMNLHSSRAAASDNLPIVAVGGAVSSGGLSLHYRAPNYLAWNTELCYVYI